MHAFAGVFVLGGVIFLIAAFLPSGLRTAMAAKLEEMEHRTALSLLVLAGLFIYWGVRLALGRLDV